MAAGCTVLRSKFEIGIPVNQPKADSDGQDLELIVKTLVEFAIRCLTPHTPCGRVRAIPPSDELGKRTLSRKSFSNLKKEKHKQCETAYGSCHY